MGVGGVVLAMKLADVCQRLCQCRPELNAMVLADRAGRQPAFAVLQVLGADSCHNPLTAATTLGSSCS